MFPGHEKVDCQFSDEKVKGQGHRTSKTSAASTFKSKLKTYLFSLSFPDLVTVK